MQLSNFSGPDRNSFIVSDDSIAAYRMLMIYKLII